MEHLAARILELSRPERNGIVRSFDDLRQVQGVTPTVLEAVEEPKPTLARSTYDPWRWWAHVRASSFAGRR